MNETSRGLDFALCEQISVSRLKRGTITIAYALRSTNKIRSRSSTPPRVMDSPKLIRDPDQATKQLNTRPNRFQAVEVEQWDTTAKS